MGLVPNTATATIANGASLSGAICLGAGVLCAIVMPAGWDAADMTFQVSDDQGATWHELLDASGTAITLSAPAAGSRYEMDAADFKSAMFLKLRSGTTGAPVNQTAARSLTVVSRKFYPVG